MNKKKGIFFYYLSTILFIFLLIVLIIGVYIGYRFSIDESIRPDWEAMSIMVTLLVSVITVFIAIYIPNKIAERQNKISLFEKRYDVYVKTANIFELAKSIIKLKEECEDQNISQKIINLFFMYLVEDFNYHEKKVDYPLFFNLVKKLEKLLMSGVFLFDNIDSKKYNKIFLLINKVIENIYKEEKYVTLREDIEKLEQEFFNFEKEYMSKMEEALKI
ncbi:hypothetical protein [Cetobacterium sp.]|uniref:hypothetical protein n=2 Tax=Cetobacterium sp. TaxID=2071632 RepID=UPI003EE5E520